LESGYEFVDWLAGRLVVVVTGMEVLVVGTVSELRDALEGAFSVYLDANEGLVAARRALAAEIGRRNGIEVGRTVVCHEVTEVRSLVVSQWCGVDGDYSFTLNDLTKAGKVSRARGAEETYYPFLVDGKIDNWDVVGVYTEDD